MFYNDPLLPHHIVEALSGSIGQYLAIIISNGSERCREIDQGIATLWYLQSTQHLNIMNGFEFCKSEMRLYVGRRLPLTSFATFITTYCSSHNLLPRPANSGETTDYSLSRILRNMIGQICLKGHERTDVNIRLRKTPPEPS